MLTIQNYVRPETLQEAYDLNQNKRNRILGGMMWLRMENIAVNTAIDLSGLGLDEIRPEAEGFFIGACVTLRRLELHEALNAATQGAVGAAVRDIVGVQFRNMATVGGSIYGRFGFSDVLTVFFAMDTTVELFHAGMVPLAEFVHLKPDRDILVGLHVHTSGIQAAYQAVRAVRTDFPVLTCCCVHDGGTLRFAVGARPGKAQLVTLQADSYRDPAIIIDEVSKQIETGSNSRGSAAYRAHLVKVLVKRTLRQTGVLAYAD